MPDLAHVGFYDYRAGTALQKPREVRYLPCTVCAKDMGENAAQARSQCMHCAKLTCLVCWASRVTGGDRALARLVPEEVTCPSCGDCMP